MLSITVPPFYCHIAHTAGPLQGSDAQAHMHGGVTLAVMAMGTFQKLIAWIDLGLVLNDEFMGLVFACVR